MKMSRRAVLQSCILAGSLLVVNAIASDQPTKPTDVPATVIAHLSLPQATGSQTLLQKEQKKLYLYVQQAGKQGFMVVDVTNPERPTLLKRVAESNQSTSGNLHVAARRRTLRVRSGVLVA